MSNNNPQSNGSRTDLPQSSSNLQPTMEIRMNQTTSKQVESTQSSRPTTGRFSLAKYREAFQRKDRETVIPQGPKVLDPITSSPNKGPKRVVYKRKKDYIFMSIEEELANENVDFNATSQEFWMPLELFDDKTYDSKTPEEWLAHGPVHAKGLYQLKNGIYVWKPLVVESYDTESRKFHGKWTEDYTDAKVPRIKIVFDVNLKNSSHNRAKIPRRQPTELPLLSSSVSTPTLS